MPRYLPSTLSASDAHIGFIAGALRIHDRRLASSKQSGVTPCKYSAPNWSGGALCSLSRHCGVIRSNVAPAKVVRVIRFVRFGAAPETSYWSGLDSTGVETPLTSTVSPLTWWQREHWATNVDWPVAASVPSSGGVYVATWFSAHEAKSAVSRPTAAMRIRAWLRPQNSVHWPRYMPGPSASIRKV